MKEEAYSKLLQGAIAGLVATAPMSAAMLLIRRLLPKREQYPLQPYQVTRSIAEKTGLRDDMNDEALTLATAASHFAYGTAAGAAYAVTAERASMPPALKGTIFGLAVWAVSYMGWLPAMGILKPATQHPAGRNVMIIAAHLIWGSTTGILAYNLEVKSDGAGPERRTAPRR